MEISGKLIKILPEARGETQRGPWVRGGFVIETDGEWPRQVAFTLFGEDRIAMLNGIAMGSPVVVNFNPESREFQDRWYTDLRCTRIQNYVPGQMPPQSSGYAWPANGAQPVMPQQPGAPMPQQPPMQQPPMPQAPAQPAAPAPGFASPLKPEEDLPF